MKSLFHIRHSKKGALDLSINAIVVLILAITMLGLGLAFIRGLFGGTVQKLTGIVESLDEETQKTLKASPDEISFTTSTLKVAGREYKTAFAIRNIRSEKIKLNIKKQFYCYDAIAPSTYKKGSLSGRQAVVADLLPSSVEPTSGTVDEPLLDKAIHCSTGTAASLNSCLGPGKLITFDTLEDVSVPGSESILIPLTVNVDSSAPQTVYSCSFEPVIISSAAGSTPPAQYDSYKRYDFNIEYKK